MKTESRANILLTASSLVIVLLGVELTLRLFFPQIHDVHPKGMYVEDEDLGYALTPCYAGRLTRAEFDTPFTTSCEGFRAGSDSTVKADDATRILLLGDSQAFGFGVEDDETLAAQLERVLGAAHPDRKFSVLNGGVPGYGTADQLALLRKRGPAFSPHLVVVQFLSVNDLSENRTPAKSWAAVRNGMLVSQNGSGDRSPQSFSQLLVSIKRFLKANSHTAKLVFDRLGYLGTKHGLWGNVDALWGEDFSDDDADLGIRILGQLIEEARSMGARTLIAYTTGQAQVLRPTYSPPRSTLIVKSAAEEFGGEWIDVSQAFQRRDDRFDLYYPQDGHWTAHGHRAAAEIIAKAIADAGLLPDKSQTPN